MPFLDEELFCLNWPRRLWRISSEYRDVCEKRRPKSDTESVTERQRYVLVTSYGRGTERRTSETRLR